MRRGRRRLVLDVLPGESIPPPCSLSGDGLTLEFTLQGRSGHWTVGGDPRPQLSRQFCSQMAAILNAGGYFESVGTLNNSISALSNFLRRIDDYDPLRRIQTIRDIDVTLIDKLDGPHSGHSSWSRLGCLVRFLRAVRELDPKAISPTLIDMSLGDRLQRVSKHGKPDFVPRDAYSPYVAEQIVQASEKEIRAALTRIRAGIEQLASSQAKEKRSEALSPTEKTLLHIASTGSIRPQRYQHILREAGIRLTTPTKPLAPYELGPGVAEAIAERLVRGNNREQIQHDLDLPAHTVRRLLQYSPEFVRMLEAEEDRYVAETKGLIAAQVELEKTIQKATESFLADNDLPGKFWLSQLKLRTIVLRHWLEHGQPYHDLASVRFMKASVAHWIEPKYGIRRINPDCFQRPAYHRETRELNLLITKLSKKYGANISLNTGARLRQKIILLEKWVAEGAPENALDDFSLDRDGLIEWQNPDLHVLPLSRSRIISTHPAFGRASAWALRLMEVLRITSQRAGQAESLSVRPFVDAQRPSIVGLQLAPSPDELIAFMNVVGLSCDADHDSLRHLKRDCLRNRRNGYCDVVYQKSRLHNQEKSERVRLGGINSAGGLITYLQEITSVAHASMQSNGANGADNLWLAFDAKQNKFVQYAFPAARFRWRSFCQRNVIMDDDGKRLQVLQPSRYRKTMKALRYRRANGNLAAVATDNSIGVAGKHYANIPSLTALHDATVERGLKHALRSARSRIIPQITDIDVQASELSKATGKPVSKCRRALDGREDVGLAGCIDFTDSPFGKKGEPCPTPFSECLHCWNSIFTKRHLPELLRYRVLMLAKLDHLQPDEWNRIYGEDMDMLDNHILPWFSVEQIAEAEAAIADDPADPGLFFLPLEIELALP